MTPDAFARVVFDCVMRAVVKALPGHVEKAVTKVTEPMLEQIGTLAHSSEKMTQAVVALVPRKEFEEGLARSAEVFTVMARSEIKEVLAALRIESDADGFLFLTNNAAGLSCALGFRPFKYNGPYEHGRKYCVNDAVTMRGSLWIARASVRDMAPNTDEGAHFWTLAVKSGKDAKANGRDTDG